MANDTKSLTLRIKGDVTQARKEIAGFSGELGKLGNRATSIGSLLKGVFAAAGIGLAIRAIVNNSVRAEQALAQVEARIKSTGAVAGFTAQQLAAHAAELQKATTFGDEDILEMQSVLLTFTKVAGENFTAATEAVLNMSIALNQDLKSAALQVGKALQDPVLGITSLRRAGVQLSAEQETMLKNFVRTGDMAAAQGIILRELETQFGGAARAARNTLGGSLKALQEAFGDLLEAKGGMQDAREGIERLVAILQDPQTVAAVENIVSVVVKGLNALAEFTTAVHFLVTGPADDMGKLEAEIDKLDRKIELRRKALQDPRALRGTGFGEGQYSTGLFASEEAINRELNVLVFNRTALMRRLDELHRKRGEELLKAGQSGTGTKPTDAAKAFQDFEKEALDDLGKRIKEEEDYNEALKKSAEAVRDLIDPSRALFVEMAKLDELRRLSPEKGGLTDEEFLDAMLEIQGRLDQLGEKTKKTTDEMTEFAKEAARGMQSAFAEEFFDILDGQMDNLGESFARLLKRLAAELAASEVMKLFTGDFGKTGEVGGLLGSLFAGFAHSGGVVGAGLPGRAVPALAFAGAERYHDGGTVGLRDDEVPIIARKGETVLTPEQMRGGRAGDVKIEVENRGTPQQAVDTDVRFDAEGMVVKVLLDDLNKGGRVSGGFARTFNLRRR